MRRVDMVISGRPSPRAQTSWGWDGKGLDPGTALPRTTRSRVCQPHVGGLGGVRPEPWSRARQAVASAVGGAVGGTMWGARGRGLRPSPRLRKPLPGRPHSLPVPVALGSGRCGHRSCSLPSTHERCRPARKLPTQGAKNAEESLPGMGASWTRSRPPELAPVREAGPAGRAEGGAVGRPAARHPANAPQVPALTVTSAWEPRGAGGLLSWWAGCPRAHRHCPPGPGARTRAPLAPGFEDT